MNKCQGEILSNVTSLQSFLLEGHVGRPILSAIMVVLGRKELEYC